MKGWPGAGLLALALTLAACAPPAPVAEEAPREGRGVGEAAAPPPPRPPHKPQVPEAEPAQSTPAPTEAAEASSAETPSGDASSVPSVAPTAGAAPTAPENPAPADQTAPAAATPPTPPQPPQTASVEPPAAPPAPPPPPPRLIGLNQAQIRALLGAPGGREDAAPATIWHYPGRNCELAIYFYFDLKSQVMRALHYEVDTHGSNELTGERCFADLVAAHQANPQGQTGTDTPR